MQKQTFGQRLRQLRMKRGMSQVDLSKGICTPSMISQVESDRATPSYKIIVGIAERLDVRLDQLLTDVDMSFENVSAYKMARALMKSHEYSLAIPILGGLLQSSKNSLSNSELLHDLGACYLGAGQLDDAEQMLNEAYRMAEMRNDTHLVCMVLRELGKLALERKKYQVAIHQWEKAMNLFTEVKENDPLIEPEMLQYLGNAYARLGQYHEALSYYSQAAVLYHQTEQPYQIGELYFKMGSSYERLGRWDKSVDFFSKAETAYEVSEQMNAIAGASFMRAVALGQAGRQDEALQLLERVANDYQSRNQKQDVGKCKVEIAKVYVQLGDLTNAKSASNSARLILDESHPWQGWVHWLFGMIALQEQQHEDAIKRFRRAAEIFQRTSMHREWEQTMHHLSKLYAQQGDHVKAYHLLDETRSKLELLYREMGFAL